MGLLKSLFNSTKLKEPVAPSGLLAEIPPTDIPGVMVGGNTAGINYVPGIGTIVGLYGLDNLRNMAGSAQTQLYSMLPELGNIKDSELKSGLDLSNYLYGRGMSNIEGSLASNIKRFREDAFRRGLAASSSMLSGMNNLYGAGANALAQLRTDSDMKGLQYAWDLANRRTDAAKFLSGLNNDIYKQINQVPIQFGLDYSIPQAKLYDSNKQLNLNRLSDYYKIYNQAINNYNNNMTKLETSAISALKNQLLPNTISIN